MAVSRVAAADKDIRPAAADLTDKIFHVVKLNSSGAVELAGANDLVYGAVSAAAKPDQGGTTVDLQGLVKVKAAGAIAAGAQVVATAGGLVGPAAAGAVNVFGVAREAATVANQIIAVQVMRGGKPA